jgi:bifunctional pyridoxal-dependent enzyme with beta-cystathionase and maltose regulon repressor activities
MKYDFDREVNRKGARSMKWEFMLEGEGFERVNIACPRALLAIAERVERL